MELPKLDNDWWMVPSMMCEKRLLDRIRLAWPDGTLDVRENPFHSDYKPYNYKGLSWWQRLSASLGELIIDDLLSSRRSEKCRRLEVKITDGHIPGLVYYRVLRDVPAGNDEKQINEIIDELLARLGIEEGDENYRFGEASAKT